VAVVNIRHRLPPFEQGFACRVEQSSPVGSGAGVSVEALGCQVWWRGFLANRAALILQLGRGGASCSDEELVALAYRRWGVGVQAHLIGEYASVVLDRAADVLLLTHDALGVVPLYYSARGQTIYFGTHLSALAAMMPDVGLDESYIAEFLLRGQCLGERTIYRGVRRLGMGRTLRYRVGGGASEHRTWWLGEVAELRYRDSRDYDDHFRELVQSAVATAAEGRTWSELSGGLDSSTVTCTARYLGVDDLQTVSVVYPTSTSADEFSWIRLVSAATGLGGHVIDGDKHKPFSILPDRALDEPSRLHITWPIFAEYESLLQAHGVDVLLSGFGGDQVLFGQMDLPIQAADYLRRGRLVACVRAVASWSPTAVSGRPLTHRLLTNAAIPALSYVRGHAIRYDRERAFARRSSWVAADLLQRTAVDDSAVAAPSPRLPTVRGQAYHEQLWRMACSAGQTWAQNTVAYRTRYPLLYRPLVEFMYSLPWQHQAVPGHDRALQRRALAEILPEQIRTRRTKSGPTEAIYAGLRKNPEVLKLLTDRPLIAQRGYVDERIWCAAAQAAQFGSIGLTPAFQAAVSLELWLRQKEKQR
jgi:asparagine synthase (glutamine-hydrolysing)